MKKKAITLALLASFCISQAELASAAHYRQIFLPNNSAVSQTVDPVQAIAPAPQRLLIAANGVEPGAVSSPQVILDKLKAANNVPADIAPTIDVEKSNTLNAATDGKNMMITTALLDRLTTDDQRAFVISHELAHVLLQHIAKTQVRRVGLSLLSSFLVRRYAAEGSLAQLASDLGIGLVDKRSSRTFEYQADDLGVKLMSQAGYQPKAALAVFDVLRANTPQNRTPEFLQSHPITDSRIQALVKKYQLTP